ncbi:MAG TPA: hypothetical protein VK534_00565 [Methylomirabilota bacterium]|nr:hypothetical protein [Methylomirabilota bacterium]
MPAISLPGRSLEVLQAQTLEAPYLGPVAASLEPCDPAQVNYDPMQKFLGDYLFSRNKDSALKVEDYGEFALKAFNEGAMPLHKTDSMWIMEGVIKGTEEIAMLYALYRSKPSRIGARLRGDHAPYIVVPHLSPASTEHLL